MAHMPQTKSEEEIKSMTVANVRKAYNGLAVVYNKILDGDLIYCPSCNEHITRTNFYKSDEYASGVFPMCKKCILAKVEQRKKKTDLPNETKESVQEMLHLMNLPYIDDLYVAQKKIVEDEVHEKNRTSPFLAYLVPLVSLPQYRGLKWSDSEFPMDDDGNPEFEIKENKKTIKSAKKRFGTGYNNEEYMFLENEYQDWISRYQCDTKAQELIFKRLTLNAFESDKARKAGKPTKDLDKTFQELLATGDITPRQNKVDSVNANAQTLGTLIQKWEEERPLPDIDPELQDVDKIGLYIDVFFRGHAAKMLGIKNSLSHLYDKFMKKYTVQKPEYDDDADSDAIFEQIFGSSMDEE